MPEEPQQRSTEIRPWNRIHVRISLLYGAVVLMVLVVLGGAIYERTIGLERDRLQRRALGAARMFGQIMGGLRVPETGEAPTLIQRSAAGQAGLRAVYAVVLDPANGDGQWLFHHGLPSEWRGEAPPNLNTIPQLGNLATGAFVQDDVVERKGTLVLSAYAPVSNGQASFVGVDVDGSTLQEVRKRTLGLLLGGLGLALALLMATTLFVGRLVQRQFEELLDAAEAGSPGTLTTGVDETRADEFGVL
ncbi:MAG: hypothetical protein VX938_07720, partial [Myxococcota bacterium]|nr:hypothetical protein [Myxococcota bacterium]